MKKILCCVLPRWLAFGLGATLLTLAVLADRLGLDPVPTWGPYRKGLFAIGCLILALSQSFRLNWLRRFIPMGWPGKARLRGAQRVAPVEAPSVGITPAGRGTSHAKRIVGWVGGGLLLPGILITYLWFATVGYWNQWPSSTDYYDKLARSFRSGRLSLAVEPDPRLALLPDPYPISARENIPVLWDASYYKGKYYLYWGPFPAVAIAAAETIVSGEIADDRIVFVGSALLFLTSSIVLLRLWRLFFEHLPGWLLVPPILLAGMAHPILWNLSRPEIYEASIAVGAGLLMSGLYFALPTLLLGKPTSRELLLAGVCFGCAIASRVNLIGGVAVLALAMAGRVFLVHRSAPSRRGLVLDLAALVGPLAVTFLVLGAYNLARFGSPLETGWRYVLSGRTEDHFAPGHVINPAYAPLNLYNYLARPVRTLTVFPFVKPISARGGYSPLPVPLPDMYYPDLVTGILVTTPFLLFGAFYVWRLLCGRSPCGARIPEIDGPPSSIEAAGLRFLSGSLVAASILNLVPLTLFFTVTSRYLLDLSPLLTILASIGSWVTFDLARSHRPARLVVSATIVTTALFSVLCALLLAITGFGTRFELMNPVLFDRLTRAFAW